MRGCYGFHPRETKRLKLNDIEVCIYTAFGVVMIEMSKNGIYQDFLATKEHLYLDVIEHYKLMGFVITGGRS